MWMDIFSPHSKNITLGINCMEDSGFDDLFTWKNAKSNT